MATVDTVVEAYRTILKREPDADGLAYWMKRFEDFVKDLGTEDRKSTRLNSSH